MAGYNWFYYFKKAYDLYPGVVTPVCGPALESHYARRRAGRGLMRMVLDVLVGLGFHAWVPWRAWRVQKRLGHDGAWRRRAVSLARTAFADPNDVALFRVDSAAAMRTYIRRYENAALNKQINPLGWTSRCALADKRLFAVRCHSAGLAHPPTVAVWEKGRLEVLQDPADRELVAKPADGEGGAGFCRLGPIADPAMLQARVSALRRVRSALVVQPLVVVHESLRDLALAALPTVRIITMVDELGLPEVVSATYRFPTDPASLVDNMKAGGLIAPVALDSGRLGSCCRGSGGGDHAQHPYTGAPVLDRQLPDWQAARHLALRAHAAAFADYVVVGWDVALSTAGPILIEGNGKPGMLMPQRAARAGLAQGRYGALLAYHLDRVSSH